MNGETKIGGSEKPKNIEEYKAERLLAALDEVTRIGNEIKKIHASAPNARDAHRMIEEQDDNYNSINGSMMDTLKRLNEIWVNWHY